MIDFCFEGSGFDRGHLIPSADHRHSQESMNNTFFLSNIAPQV
jgi:endonuclease G